TQRLLARGARLTELLKQPQFKPVPVEEQVVAIFAGTRGYLDEVPVEKVGAFESQALSDLKANHGDLLDTLRRDREIKPETEKSLVGFFDGFAKAFA
ncbi:MAG: F0F1 ATP synthase subunit alpha, partial [Acidisphaera sp.]|nr:F0F1 ATP synthase subunit alpha [Acidisphaera sp.]